MLYIHYCLVLCLWWFCMLQHTVLDCRLYACMLYVHSYCLVQWSELFTVLDAAAFELCTVLDAAFEFCTVLDAACMYLSLYAICLLSNACPHWLLGLLSRDLRLVGKWAMGGGHTCPWMDLIPLPHN